MKNRVWISTQEAAALRGCSDRAIRDALQRGSLRGKRSGRVWLVDIRDLAPKAPGRPRNAPA